MTIDKDNHTTSHHRTRVVKIACVVVSFIIICTVAFTVTFFFDKAESPSFVDNAQKEMKSPIIGTETTETVRRSVQGENYIFDEQDCLHNNPERGFYSTSVIKVNESGITNPHYPTKSSVSKLLFLKIDLSALSGNMNDDAIDKPLTRNAIEDIAETLQQIKQNDNTVILRIVYDACGARQDVAKYEPSQEMILNHVEQLGPIFQEYASTINVIQCGFYGEFGECSSHTDVRSHPEYYQQLVSSLLEATKDTEITIALRTPQYYSWCRGIDIKDIESDEEALPREYNTGEISRVGIYNDGYGGSSTDLGTYLDRNKETQWLSGRSIHTFYGGEAVIDIASSIDNEIVLGEYNDESFFIPEAFKLHTNYLNWEWNQLLHNEWSKQNYSGGDETYLGAKALTYIENHLGYRLVVRNVDIPDQIEREESRECLEIPISIDIENVGFGNIIKSKKTEVIVTNAYDKEMLAKELNEIDARDFLSKATIKNEIKLEMPANKTDSTLYNVYIRISSGEKLDDGSYYSAIRFANDNMWNDSIQANLIGQFSIIDE